MAKAIVSLAMIVVSLALLVGCGDYSAHKASFVVEPFSFTQGDAIANVAPKVTTLVTERLVGDKSTKVVISSTDADYILSGNLDKVLKSRKTSRKLVTVFAELTVTVVLRRASDSAEVFRRTFVKPYQEEYVVGTVFGEKQDKVSMHEVETEAIRLLTLDIHNAIKEYLRSK
ncbi:MAG: hypothetical protein Kow00107_08080 [Planctomycetota bacterium]